jgi:hypothetical protein
VGVHKHQLRFVRGHLVFMYLCKRRDDDQVARRCTPRRRSVDRDHAAAPLALDGVGDEAFAVVDVPDVNLLVLGDVGCVQQVFVDGA